MRFCLILLFLVGLSAAFDVQLKYRCSSSQCSYYFVVPEIVAGYVDPNVLQSDVNGLAGSIDSLKNLLIESERTESDSMTIFTQTVDAQYNASSPVILNVTQQTTDPVYLQSVQSLSDSSAQLILNTNILVSKMGCFKDGTTPSVICKQYPTTTAAPTTTALPNTKVTVVTTGAPIGSSPSGPVTQQTGEVPVSESTGETSVGTSVAATETSPVSTVATGSTDAATEAPAESTDLSGSTDSTDTVPEGEGE